MARATLELFLQILGTEAANLALKMLATGGVYLGGGISPRILSSLNKGQFMEAFKRKGRFTELVTHIPVHVILNPKVALFFLAFLPQFIDPQAANKPLAFLFLGAIFNVNGTLWNLFVAWSAARMGAALRGRAAAWLQRCIGGFFVVLGVKLALAER